jgi:hypothetical protein
LFTGAQGFPIRNNGRYYLYGVASDGDANPMLTNVPALRTHILGPADMPAIDGYVDKWKAPYVFMAFTQSGITYAHGYGQLPDGSLENLQKTFAEDPGWKQWYQNGDVTIYEKVNK